jgi:hypothetical protein
MYRIFLSICKTKYVDFTPIYDPTGLLIDKKDIIQKFHNDMKISMDFIKHVYSNIVFVPLYKEPINFSYIEGQSLVFLSNNNVITPITEDFDNVFNLVKKTSTKSHGGFKIKEMCKNEMVNKVISNLSNNDLFPASFFFKINFNFRICENIWKNTTVVYYTIVFKKKYIENTHESLSKYGLKRNLNPHVTQQREVKIYFPHSVILVPNEDTYYRIFKSTDNSNMLQITDPEILLQNMRFEVIQSMVSARSTVSEKINIAENTPYFPSD